VCGGGLITTLTRLLAADTSLWTDDVWVVDSTPVECGRSRDTTRRSDLAGWAEYGYCASHSRWFWGLRLHLVATLGGLPIAFAIIAAKADERQTLLSILAADPHLAAARPGQTLIADRQYYGTAFEATLAAVDAVRRRKRSRVNTPDVREFPRPGHLIACALSCGPGGQFFQPGAEPKQANSGATSSGSGAHE
jgi:hypothetical protein